MRKRRRLKNKQLFHRFAIDQIVDKIIDEILAEEAQANAAHAKNAK